MTTKYSSAISMKDPKLASDANLLFMLKGVSSVMPAKVLNVNYDKVCVDVEVLITTEITEDRYVPYPKLYEVPLYVYSGDGGKARQTMPVQVGDIVELTFADRDTVNFLLGDGSNIVNPDSDYPLSMGGQHYVLLAKPSIPLQATTRPIERDSLVTEYEHSKITQKADGTLNITNSKGGTLTLKPDSTLTFSGQTVSVNGCKITPDGNVVTKSGVNLDDFYKQFTKHVHGGVSTGSGKTGTPES